MRHVYIVRRDDETDVFTDITLAEEWADFIGGSVYEEGILDRESIALMKEDYEKEAL